MRSKEEAHDYRYFPDPDLLPVEIGADELERWRDELPELPQARVRRFVQMTALPQAEAEVLAQSRPWPTFLRQPRKKPMPERLPTACLVLCCGNGNARNVSLADCAHWAMKPQALAELVRIVDQGLISAKIANEIFGELFESGAMPEAFVKERGLAQISDSSALEAAVDAVIAANPEEVAAYRDGKTKLIGFFVGQVMRATKGKANPALVNELLNKKLR